MKRPFDGRALTARGVNRIEENIYKGKFDDHEIARLFETIRVQRKVLRAMFDLFKPEINIRESTADPIRNSTLAYLKELVSMEDPKCQR